MFSKSEYYVIRKQINSEFYSIIQITNRNVILSNIPKEKIEEEFEKIHQEKNLPFQKKKEKDMSKIRLQAGSEEAKERMRLARETYRKNILSDEDEIKKQLEIVSQKREEKRLKLQFQELNKSLWKMAEKLSKSIETFNKEREQMIQLSQTLHIPIPEIPSI